MGNLTVIRKPLKSIGKTWFRGLVGSFGRHGESYGYSKSFEKHWKTWFRGLAESASRKKTRPYLQVQIGRADLQACYMGARHLWGTVKVGLREKNM